MALLVPEEEWGVVALSTLGTARLRCLRVDRGASLATRIGAHAQPNRGMSCDTLMRVRHLKRIGTLRDLQQERNGLRGVLRIQIAIGMPCRVPQPRLNDYQAN